MVVLSPEPILPHSLTIGVSSAAEMQEWWAPNASSIIIPPFHPEHECTCSMTYVSHYQKRLAGPLLDGTMLKKPAPRGISTRS